MNEFSGVKKLRRTRRGRIIAGVCSGVGEYFGVDANIIRIALAIASFFGGLGVAIYAIGWLLLPDEDKETSIVQELVNKQRNESPWTQAPGDYQREPYSRTTSEPTDAPTQAPGSEYRPQG